MVSVLKSGTGCPDSSSGQGYDLGYDFGKELFYSHSASLYVPGEINGQGKIKTAMDYL